MMDKIGLYCSAIRPHLWMNLYNNLKNTNKSEFEIMFVGNVIPEFELPPNMKFIYSNVKPAQCWYIAATRVDGDYLINVADDLLFSDGALDDILRTFKKQTRQENLFVGPLYMRDEIVELGPLPVCSFMKRETWDGFGIDNIFSTKYCSSSNELC